MTGEGIRKKRDPIFSVCFVVFVVACVGVLGTYVDEHYIQTDDTKVAYGDKVMVDYTGAYYAYYGEDGAVVFDTSYASIGDNDDIVKANEWTSKSSYSDFEVTVGSGKALEMFENSLIGHKVGDKFKVEIPVGEGYLAPGEEQTASKNVTVPRIQVLTKAQFDAIYEDIDLKSGQTAITSAYGWPATATFNANDNTVTIVNNPENGETYEYIGNEDSKFGKVTYSVTGTSGDITATMNITDTTSVDGGIQMLKVDVDGNPIYITSVSNDGYTYKTCEEKCNITLYFEIEIVSINA